MTHVMHYFTIEQREELQTEMNKRASALRHEISDALRKSDTEDGAYLASHVEELDDEAVASLEESIDAAQLEHDLKRLRAMETALRRLHTPEFGLCEGCGSDIPFSRLLAEPSATRCVACQTAYEHQRREVVSKP